MNSVSVEKLCGTKHTLERLSSFVETASCYLFTLSVPEAAVDDFQDYFAALAALPLPADEYAKAYAIAVLVRGSYVQRRELAREQFAGSVAFVAGSVRAIL